MATQQIKVGLDYRRYTESKQATGSINTPNPLSSTISTSNINRPATRTTSRIPTAGLMRSVSNIDRTDRAVVRGTGIIGAKPRIGIDRPTSNTIRQVSGKDSNTATTTHLNASASARILDKSSKKPNAEPSLKQSIVPGRGTTPQDKRPTVKRGKDMSINDIKEAHPLSQEEKLAARKRAEVLHENLLNHQHNQLNIESVPNSAVMNHAQLPEPRAYEYPSGAENPLYKSNIQTKLITDAHSHTSTIQDHKATSPVSGIDASIEAAMPPSVFTKSCAIVTDILNDPYAGISVENLLTEMARLEQLVKDNEIMHKTAVTEMQEKIAAGECKAKQLEKYLEDKAAEIRALEDRLKDMDQVAAGMIKERTDLDTVVQSLNTTIVSLQGEINSLVVVGKKQEEKHIVEINDIRGAMQKAVEDVHKRDREKIVLEDKIHELEGILNEARQHVVTSESETNYIKAELMELSEKVKEYVSNERELVERLTKKDAEIAQLQEEIHQYNSEKTMKEFGKSAESLFSALVTVDFSAQINFLDDEHNKEANTLKDQIVRLETELSNYKATYRGVKIVPSENGDVLQNDNHVDVRILPCEHCNRGVDFVQAMLDLVDLRKMETEWMVDTNATREENVKLKAALLELGRRYKALQANTADNKPLSQNGSTPIHVPASSSSAPLGTGLVSDMEFPEHQDPDEENRTLNFAYMKEHS